MKQAEKETKYAPHPPLKAKHKHKRNGHENSARKKKLKGEKVTNIYLIIYFYIKINVYLKQTNQNYILMKRRRIAKYEMLASFQ